MKISERLALLKAGYTKEEINALIDEEMQTPTDPEVKSEPEQKAEDFTKVITALAEEVKGLKKAMQTENIENTKMGNESQADAIDRILQSVINPIDKEKEK